MKHSRRNKPLSEWKKKKITNLWNRGYSLGAICEIANVSARSVYKYADYSPITKPTEEFMPLFLKKRIMEEKKKLEGKNDILPSD